MRDAIGRWTGTRSVFQVVTLSGTVFLCLAGCGGGNGSATALSAPPPVTPPAASPPPPPPPPPPAMTTLRGVMTGAHKAIQGASIVLYRVGVRGYGSPATALGSTTTDAAGAWAVSFAKPTDDPLVYVVASGGKLGGGANEAIGLLTAIGPLSQAPSRVTVNEVTTVASAFALAQFLDRDTATNIGSAVANTIGLPNAFGNVGNLVNVTSGVAFTSPDAFTPIVNPLTQASEAPPGRVIDSLAELIAACIGSSGSTSTNCSALFGLTIPEGGPVPTNTRQAIRTIALHPESNVTALYDLSRTAAAMFAPDLDAAVPNDWTLVINFTGGALAGSIPLGVAIDAAGDAWITNQHCVAGLTGGPGCVIELHPQGSQAGPFPRGIGLDFSSRGAGAIAIGTNPNRRLCGLSAVSAAPCTRSTRETVVFCSTVP